MDAMAKKIRKCLYVDMSNLYGGASKVLQPGEYFDMATLFAVIDKEFGGVDMFKVYGAYMGLTGVTDASDVLFVKAQNEFFNSAKVKGVHFGKGNISRHKQEKGVDMQLGVDMVHDAHLDSYDDAIILSGDADFYYPITLIKSMGKTLHYCGFATRYSNHLAHQAWRKVILDYNQHFARKVLPTIKGVPKKLTIVDLGTNKSVLIKTV